MKVSINVLKRLLLDLADYYQSLCTFSTCLSHSHSIHLVGKIFGLTQNICKEIIFYSLVSIGAEASGLVVFLAVDVCGVVELLVTPQQRTSPLLILKMPIEAGERPVLLTLVLQKQGTLFHSKLLQVPETREN